jgi:hypothetical protein
MAKDKVISWAEYQSRKAISKAAVTVRQPHIEADVPMSTNNDFYVPSAGSTNPKKEPKYYDFEDSGTSRASKSGKALGTAVTTAVKKSYDGTYGYGNYDNYQKGVAKPALAVYERCFHNHKPLKITVADKDYFIYGGSCSDPVVKDADIYVGFERFMKDSTQSYPWSSGASFTFPIVDGNVPTSVDDTKMLLKYLADNLAAGKKIHIGCIGGHGRTGTILAALVTYMTGNKDSIEYVRKNYCEKAVETTTQIQWLNKHWGIEKATPSKGHYTSTHMGLGAIGKTAGVSKSYTPRSAAKEGGSVGYHLFETVKPVKVKGSVWGF